MNKDKVIAAVLSIGLLLAIFSLWFVFTKFEITDSVLTQRILFIAILACIIYFTSDVVGLLYTFYEMPRPWQRFVPVISEFYMLDMRYRKPAYITLALSCVALLFAAMPYQMKAIFGTQNIAAIGFYGYFMAFCIFFVCQLIVGIGLLQTTGDIAEEWEAHTGVTLGAISMYKIFAIFPIVRVFTFYGLRKPLDTLVTFRNQTVSTTQQVRIIEEDDE